MTSILVIYLPWLLASAAFGAVVGRLAGPASLSPTTTRGLWLGLLLAVALLAATALIPGRPGHAAEVAVWMAFVYAVGCVIGDRLAAAEAAPLFEKLRAHRPPAIERPDDGGDDLTLVGASLTEARTLGEVGIWRLAQLVAWTPQQMEWVGARVGVPVARVRDEWVAGARQRLVRSNGAALAALAPSAGDLQSSELLRIAGVGPRIAAALAAMGVRRIDQVAAWRPADMAWIGERLGEPGRIEREMWAPQARLLYAGVDTTASVRRLTKAPASDADAPLDATALESLRAELEELSAAAGVAAFAPDAR